MVTKLESDVTFTPTAGTLSFGKATLAPTTVSAPGYISMVITPAHGLIPSDSPSLAIELPVDFEVDGRCLGPTKNDALGTGRTCTGDPTKNSITVESLVTSRYTGGNELSFTIGPVKLPRTTAGGKGEFKITTYVKDAVTSETYPVDTGKGSWPFQITPGGFESASVSPGSLNAFVKAKYTFKLKPTHSIPQYGLIMVEYPE